MGLVYREAKTLLGGQPPRGHKPAREGRQKKAGAFWAPADQEDKRLLGAEHAASRNSNQPQQAGAEEDKRSRLRYNSF